jgi:hypothetical protein
VPVCSLWMTLDKADTAGTFTMVIAIVWRSP